MLDTSRTVPAALSSINPAYSKQKLLRFYTVTVIMNISSRIPRRISWPERQENDGHMLHMTDRAPSAALYDVEGCFAGLLIFDLPESLSWHGKYELILLSDSQNSLFYRMDLPDQHQKNPFVSYQGSEQEWRLYWVMLIIWDKGVAERRGLGQILQSSIKKSFQPGPQWKEIVLG
jgi:hypothetical protein